MTHDKFSAKRGHVKKQAIHIFPIKWLAAGPDLKKSHISLNLKYL
jgi:hypothetical protein